MTDTYISFYLKTNRIRVFVDAIRGIGSPKYICLLIDEKGENLAVVPYRKKDFHSHRVPRELYSNTRGMEISSLKLCQIISQKYNWNPASSYRVPGKVIPEKGLALFFLARGEAICDEIQRQKGLTWTRPDLLH